MQCELIRTDLITSEGALSPAVQNHLDGCPACTSLAARVRRLDALVQPMLVVQPPLDLQVRLQRLARASAQPVESPDRSALETAWDELRGVLRMLVPWTSLGAAQGFAALLVGLAAWQVYGWVQVLNPVMGDVPLAIQLATASPVVGALGYFSQDVQNALLWLGVGLCGWLVSEASPITRYMQRRHNPTP